MLKGKGKIFPKGKTVLIYVPAEIVTDSQFPLPKEKGSEVCIEIVNGMLAVTNPAELAS